MADLSRQSEINHNIKRNLGVFTVPTYLSQQDPYDKYGAADCSTQARPARRDGLTRAQPTAWWKEGIKHEWRRVEAARLTMTEPAPSPAVESAPTFAALYAAEPHESAPAAGSWVYHAAGVTAHGPGGVPSLVYVPYWVPIAKS